MVKPMQNNAQKIVKLYYREFKITNFKVQKIKLIGSYDNHFVGFEYIWRNVQIAWRWTFTNSSGSVIMRTVARAEIATKITGAS